MNHSQKIINLLSAIGLLFFFIFTSLATKAAEIKRLKGNVQQNLQVINGHVTDENGNPISGVILTVKWTEKESISDENGAFKIENVAAQDTVFIKHPGYQNAQFVVERAKLNYFVPLKKASKNISSQTRLPVQGKTIDITGRIYDDIGNALPDAILVVKGQNQGGSTNNIGEFSLSRVPLDSTVVVTHVRFFSEEFLVKKEESNYQVALRKNPMLLNEIIISGYGNDGHSPRNKGFKLSEKQRTITEQNPEFPGGTQALYKFLAENMKYPSEASINNIMGKVFISFTVNADGNIRNPQIVKGIGFGIDEEVLRAVLNMPRWTPAIQNGKAVSKEFVLPLKFALE